MLCQSIGIAGAEFFAGDEKAKDWLFEVVDIDKNENDSEHEGEMRALAACYLYDDRGKTSEEDEKRLESWKEKNPNLFAVAETIKANSADRHN